MEQGQDTWRGFGLSCSGKSGSAGSTRMDPGRTGKGRERQGKELLPGNTSARIHECYEMYVTKGQ